MSTEEEPIEEEPKLDHQTMGQILDLLRQKSGIPVTNNDGFASIQDLTEEEFTRMKTPQRQNSTFQRRRKKIKPS